ncbi:MAG: hypothetical protein PHQ27_10460, partial [Victivallales bacterium]|nr:hypothetical protein [Victivallales bacterium]
PISVNATAYWELKSWDRFQIPKPWAKLTLVMGEGLDIPSDLDENGIAFWQEEARRHLMAITVDTP